MRISDWSSDVCSSELQHLVDPAAVHVDHLEAQPAVVEALAGVGNVAEPLQDEAGEGVEAAVALQPRQAEAVFELVDRQRACDQPGAVAAPDDTWLRQLAALRPVAGDRPEAVGEGADAFGRAVLVDHKRPVDALAAATTATLQPRGTP